MAQDQDEPIDECDACGADLFFGEIHDCPVLGTCVKVEDDL